MMPPRVAVQRVARAQRRFGRRATVVATATFRRLRMTTYRVLLPHPLEARLLMMNVHGDWRLPEWTDATEHEWHVTTHVNRAVQARFGMETTVLRCVQCAADPATRLATVVYELDNHSAPHDAIPSSTWIGASELGVVPIGDVGTRELVGDWFERERSGATVPGAAWTRRGWYVEALAWSATRLRELGHSVLGVPEQLRAWERSFLMRLVTDGGTFYFKAAPPMFAHEPALMQWLWEQYPSNFPEIVAVDLDRGWLLQREAGGAALPLSEVREEEEWFRAVRRLAEIQLDCAGRTQELSEVGCPYRGLEVLARRIPRLCAHVAAMDPSESSGLSGRELERFGGLAPTLLSLCEELASCGVPDSIEHGDLDGSNVLSTLSGPIYLDWSDSSLSHPFFSMSPLMAEAASVLPAASHELRGRLRDSYLAPWHAVVAPEVLTRAFDIARILAPVHLGATLHAELLPAAGHRWELERALPRYLRTALQALADADDGGLSA
jgi:hypothetical protein